MELLGFALGMDRFKIYPANMFVEDLKQEYVNCKHEKIEVHQVLGRTIISRSEERKEVHKAILAKDKKANYKFKYAIDLLDEITDGMEPDNIPEEEEIPIIPEQILPDKNDE
jgi:hypothetical protein